MHIGGYCSIPDSPSRLKLTDYGGYSPIFLLKAAFLGEVKKVPYLLEFKTDYVRSNPGEFFRVILEYFESHPFFR